MDYTNYVIELATLVVSQSPDPDFDNILPACIDYAEQRIYRELNLLVTVQGDYTTTLTLGNRSATIINTFVAVNSIAALTPAGSSGGNGTRVPLVPVSMDMLNSLWPGNDVTGVPQMFAMLTQWEIVVGPSPDAAYNLEVLGTFRPAPLSITNQNTFLTDRLPDLFLAASMVFMSGYMRNFGQQSNDPAMAQSWETQYGLLKGSADVEELRKHFWASSWSSQPLSAQAQPQRG